MTREQKKATLEIYRKKFIRWSTERADTAKDTPPGMGRAVRHVNWMTHEMLRRMETGEDEPGQAERWIGFIQGILWCEGLCSIDEMMAHNRTQEPNHEQPG